MRELLHLNVKNALHKKDKEWWTIRICFFIFFMLLAYFSPRTLDDWTWGSNIGLERLRNGFAGYNGRYVGNMIVIVMTRLPKILCAGLQALVMTACCQLVYQLVYRQLMAAGAVILLFVFIPNNILAQTYVWVAGFSNYVISLLLLLVYLWFVSKVYKQEEKKADWRWILVLAFGIAMQLVVENVTIYFLLTSIVINILYYTKNKKINGYFLALSAGHTIGTIIMFSNRAYHAAVSGNEEVTYKKIDEISLSFDYIVNVWQTFCDDIVGKWFMNNVVLNIVICLLLVFCCVRFTVKGKKIWMSFYIVSLVYFIFSIWSSAWLSGYAALKMLQAVFVIVFCLSLVVFFALYVQDERYRFSILLSLLSQIPLMTPLIVSSPVSMRCFLTTYALFAVFVGQVFAFMTENGYIVRENREKWNIRCVIIVCISIAICFGRYTIIYGNMNAKAEERLEYIRQEVAKGKKEIKIFYIPDSAKYSLGMNPKNELWQYNFKNYYDIPQDVTFRYYKYEKWKKKVKKG